MKDLVIFNGQINTMDPRIPYAEALAVKDGKIITVGSNEDVKKAMPFGAEVIDAKENSVFPGFFDTHVHLTFAGLNMTGVKLEKARSKEELIDILKTAEKELSPGMWLRGTGYDETIYPGRSMLTMKELDEAFGPRPVMLERIDAHQIAVNSAAFTALGLNVGEQGVETDPLSGEPTGIVRDPANGKAHSRFSDELITDDMRRMFLRKACDQALRMGTTSISALEGGALFSDRDTDVILDIKDSLPINIKVYHQTMDVNKVISEGLDQIGGCIVLDGSLGSHTAALFYDYSDKPGCRGELYYSQKEIDDFVLEAHVKGLQVSMHCIGDRAIERLLTAYERAIAKVPRSDHRHRFEHFSVSTADQAVRARALGCCLAMQPSYIPGADMMLSRLGEERMKRSLNMKTLMEMGLKVGGGSDAPITPIDPFHGIACAMEHYNPDERMSFWDAVRMFTSDAAYLTFEEGKRGSLSPGKYADIAISDCNITEMDLKDTGSIRDIGFSHTICDGEIRYEK